jgi:hypothetical protein
LTIEVRGYKEFNEVYSELEECDYLKHRIDDAIDLLKQDANRGEMIERKLWPNKYKVHEITNLFRYEITKRNYRLIYTIMSTPNAKILVLLDFVDHKKYNKIFGYS